MENDIVLKNKEVSERERLLFDEFLEEYKKDYDPERACLRLGVEPESVNRALLYFFQSSYVQQQLAKDGVLFLVISQNIVTAKPLENTLFLLTI